MSTTLTPQRKQAPVNPTLMVHIQDPDRPFPTPLCRSKVLGVKSHESADCRMCVELYEERFGMYL